MNNSPNVESSVTVAQTRKLVGVGTMDHRCRVEEVSQFRMYSTSLTRGPRLKLRRWYGPVTQYKMGDRCWRVRNVRWQFPWTFLLHTDCVPEIPDADCVFTLHWVGPGWCGLIRFPGFLVCWRGHIWESYGYHDWPPPVATVLGLGSLVRWWLLGTLCGSPMVREVGCTISTD